MTDTDKVDGDTQINGIWNSLNNQSVIKVINRLLNNRLTG